MLHLIPYLTVPLTLFIFIAIILINVGGVNYTLSPIQSFVSYEYHIYLNRLCTFSQSAQSNYGSYQVVSGQCVNSRLRTIEDGSNFYSPNALVGDVSPFRFSTVHPSIPLAFYILTALCVFVLLFCAPFGGKRLNRGVALFGALVSAFAFIFIIIASSVITSQIFHLKSQLENDTRRATSLVSLALGSSVNDYTNYITTINHVDVGTVALGLTWACVAAILIEYCMWAWAWFQVKRECPWK